MTVPEVPRGTRPTPKTDVGRPRRIRPAWLVAAGCVALAVVMATTAERPVAVTVVGHARCSSGAAVVGIWVQTSRSGGGFADPLPDATGAAFSYVVRQGTAWGVHVGCGGDPHDWATDSRGAVSTATTGAFVCDDGAALAAGVHVGRCALDTPTAP